MPTTDRLESFLRRTVRAMRELSPAERDVVVRGVLEADPELYRVLPELRATCDRARYLSRLGPLRRDSVM